MLNGRPVGPCHHARPLVALVFALAWQPPAPAALAQTCLDYPQYMHRVSGTLLPASGSYPHATGGTVIVRDHPFAAGHKVAFALSGGNGEWHVTAVDVTDPLALDYPVGGDDELGRLTQATPLAPRQMAFDPDFPSRPYLYVTTWGDPAGFLHVVEVTDPDPGSPSNTDIGFSILSAVDRWPQPAGVGLYKVGSNTYAAVSRGGYSSFVYPAFLVFDVTNPAAPAEVGSLTIGAAGRVTLSGTTAYVPGQWGVSVVDLANPAAPADLGSIGVPGLTRVAVGALPPHYLFAVGTSDPYLHVHNSTPPFAEVASLGVGGGFTSVGGDVVVSGNTLFCQTVDGVLAIDITLPTAPVLRGSAEANGLEYGNGDAYRALALAVDGDYAYAMGPQNGLQVVDISNTAAPATPRLAGFVPGDIEVAGNLMVAANGSEFRVIDVSLPETPVVRSTTVVASNSKPVVIGHHAFLGSGCNFQSWDLTNPGAPAKVSDGAVGSCFAWLAAGYDAPGASPDCVYWGHNCTILVVDISNPAAPSLATPVGEPCVFGGVVDLEVSGGFLYALSPGGLGLWSLSAPTAPARIGEIAHAFGASGTGVGSIAVQGSYAYIGAGNTFYVVDTFNPASPTIAGTLSGLGDIQDVVVKGTRVYVALGSAGISVVDVSNPTAPKLAGALNPTGTDRGYLYDLYVANDVIFGSDGGNGLWSLPVQCGAGTLTVSTVTPSNVGNLGPVTVRISGVGFEEGVTVDLVSGPNTVTGNVARSSSFELTAIFDLTGASPGSWTIVATNPGGSPAQLVDAVSVLDGGQTDVWVSLSAPTRIRAGFDAYCDVLVHNDGNIDALGVWVGISGIPIGWAVSVENPIRAIYEGLPSSLVTVGPDVQFVSLFAPSIRAGGGTFLVRVKLTPPAGNTDTIRLSAGAGELGTRQGLAPGAMARGTLTATSGGELCGADVPLEVECAATLIDAVFDCAGISPDPGSAVLLCTYDLNVKLPCTAADIGEELTEIESEGALGKVVSAAQVYTAAVDFLMDAVADCAGIFPAATPVTDIYNAVECASTNLDFVVCFIEWVVSQTGASQTVESSLDPNEKLGPLGHAGGFVKDGRPVTYTVRFENLPAATLPARRVTIEDVLPTSQLDPATVMFHAVGFGNRVHSFGAGVQSFAIDFDLRPGQNQLVRATGGVNQSTGAISVVLEGLDPATQLPPADPLVGWLPPDVVPPEGQGQVIFSARPAAVVGQGQSVCNQASIVFDLNPAIITNLWCNAVDETAPQSTVGSLVAVQPAATFPVTCTGSDVGSGIVFYDIHVSTDGASPALWKRSSTGAEQFKGLGGHTYAFYSSAKDSAGNVEPLAGTPDATTQIPLDAVDVPEHVEKIELALHRVIPLANGAGVAFDLSWPGTGRGRIALYDVAGRRLWERVLDGMPAGRHQVQAMPGVKSGVYWARLASEGRKMTQKVVLVR